MQTKQQIERLLASVGASPNKRLGQNFLIDLNLARFLVDSANITSDDVVLEVGCGTGSLTEAFAEKAGVVIAVEYDRALAPIAARQLCDAGNVIIINADILKGKSTLTGEVVSAVSDACADFPGKLKLVANLPYNVGSVVMANLIIGPTVVDEMYVTVQKEVAHRMIAVVGDKCYGTLSILMGAAGDVKIIRNLPPSVFWPAPKVESTIVRFYRQQEKVRLISDMQVLHDVIALFMCHRRKTLRACVKFATGVLADVDWPGVMESACVNPTDRPERLSADKYVAMSNLCSM